MPSGRQPIDQVPMYGGMDRKAVPELKKADEDFISRTSAAFGGREQAAKRWVDQGFVFHKKGQPDMAMKRFNQAWLLDPKNPEVYWGFGAVLLDRDDSSGAYGMLMRAYKLGFREASFVADLGRVSALRVTEPGVSTAQRSAYLAESERYFQQALRGGKKQGYVYGNWANAKYWSGDYAAAWQKVKLARQHGEELPPQFLSMLRAKMPES